MNEKARKIVNERLDIIFPDGVRSLYFSDYDSILTISKNPFEKLSLGDSIIKCLELMKDFCSSTKNYLETGDDCNRSVIDIWRHLRYYNTKLTIFDVMRELYILVDMGSISTFICPNIKRRVFIYGEDDFYANDLEIHDTLHLTFYEWENI